MVTKLLSCSEHLDVSMLYAIWERVVQENQQEITGDSVVEIDFLKES